MRLKKSEDENSILKAKIHSLEENEKVMIKNRDEMRLECETLKGQSEMLAKIQSMFDSGNRSSSIAK